VSAAELAFNAPGHPLVAVPDDDEVEPEYVSFNTFVV
jgi:hypothetical protein